MRTAIALSAWLLGAAAAAPALAGNVPAEGSADLAFNTNVPGERDTAFTAPEYEAAVEVADPVDPAAVRDLRELAIEEFGQASSKSEEPAADAGAPPGVQDHAQRYFERVRERGVDLSGAG